MFDLFKEYARGQSNVTDEQLELVKDYLKPVKVNKGDVLLAQDEISQHAIFVVKGCLRSYVTYADQKTHVLEFAPEGWWIGDPISLYMQIPSLFVIDAVEDSEVYLTGKDFFSIMPQIFPEFHRLYIYNMNEKMRTIQKRVLHLLGSNADERYLDFITTFPDLSLRLPQHMIASYLGISPESLSRIRGKIANRT